MPTMKEVFSFLRSNAYVDRDSFYPLTKVLTQEDKDKLSSMGYNPGYTVSEWPYQLPIDKIYYGKHLVPNTYYYDWDSGVIPIILRLDIYGRQHIFRDESVFCNQILSFVEELKNPTSKLVHTYLVAQDDGLRSLLLAEYVRRSESSPELFDLFLSLYTVTDYGAGVYGVELIEKLASGRSEKQIRDIQVVLSDYGDEFTVYRGESDDSTSYQRAFSWSVNINAAYFFACRRGDLDRAKIVCAKVRKKDVVALNFNTREEEVIVVPGVPYDITEELLIGPNANVMVRFPYFDTYYKGRDLIQNLYGDEKSDHDRLHSMRVLFLALSIIHVGKIKLNNKELWQLVNAIAFHDVGRANDEVDEGHGRFSREIYERNGEGDPDVGFLIEYHCKEDCLAEDYLHGKKERILLLYRILKDADALDRVRFDSYSLDVKQLRIPISHRLVPLAMAAVDEIKP